MNMQDKVRENKDRRWAERLGLFLRKSRARFWNIDDHMGYMLLDPAQNIIITGEKYDLKLDDVEIFLQEYQQKISTSNQEEDIPEG